MYLTFLKIKQLCYLPCIRFISLGYWVNIASTTQAQHNLPSDKTSLKLGIQHEEKQLFVYAANSCGSDKRVLLLYHADSKKVGWIQIAVVKILHL